MWVRGSRSRDRSPPGERQLEPPPRFPSPGDLTGGGCDRSRGKFWKRIQPLCAPHALNAGRGCSCAPGGLSPFSFLQRPALRSCTDSTLPMPIACSHLPSLAGGARAPNWWFPPKVPDKKLKTTLLSSVLPSFINTAPYPACTQSQCREMVMCFLWPFAYSQSLCCSNTLSIIYLFNM